MVQLSRSSLSSRGFNLSSGLLELCGIRGANRYMRVPKKLSKAVSCLCVVEEAITAQKLVLCFLENRIPKSEIKYEG